jgi:hypothetical protein
MRASYLLNVTEDQDIPRRPGIIPMPDFRVVTLFVGFVIKTNAAIQKQKTTNTQIWPQHHIWMPFLVVLVLPGYCAFGELQSHSLCHLCVGTHWFKIHVARAV